MKKVSLPTSLKWAIPICLVALVMAPTVALAHNRSIGNELRAPSAGNNSPVSAVAAATVYQPTWASVDTHPPAPEWFQDAKFGIYYHWGVYSVPARYSEWYPRNMYNRDGNSGEYQHHMATYGDPFGNWPYHNFINGANNKAGQWTQFAPRLVSAGGAFDPDAWAQLFADSGAKFAGPVAEHHDGFSMWDSTVNEWNSVDKGPRLDLARLFATSIRARGMKYLMSSHSAYNFTGYYQWVPSQSDPSLQKLYGKLPSTQEYQLWLDKLKEMIDGYQPDIIWHDFNLSAIPESYRLQYLAYYYNAGIDWNKEVVTTYKDGFNQRGEILDYERGGPGDLTSYYWLTDDAISSSTWSYTQGMGYYSTTAILHSLIDRVSKNGNLLLNISPMADGTIPSQQQTILRGMGDWLWRNGEAIYSTRAWTVYGEGPTKMGGGTFQQPIAGTNKDFRFTRSKDNTILYAVVLGWPGNGAQMKITSLASGKINLSGLTAVQLINNPGSYTNLSYQQDSTGLNVTMPASQPFSALAYAFRLTFSGQIPARVVFYQDVNYGGTAVSLSPGTYTTAQLSAAGIPDNWASSVTVPAGYTVEIYDLDNLGGTRWAFTTSNADFIAAGLNDRMSSVRITGPTNNTFTLTVSKTGNGTGTVTSSPSGINCGSTCSASYTSGTSVTLTAQAAGGSTFGGWSGACSGTSTTCMLSMTQARSVTASFTPQGTGTGTILREYWNNISGTAVTSLTSNANYPNNPSGSGQLTSLEGPTNTADNYGSRIRGYVHPPASGAYTFWLASDDYGELWLSTSDNPANATRIAYVDGWTNSREWTKYASQQSAAITLTAGQKVYIEVLQKEATGGDNVAVAWQGPGISQAVIAGAYLSPFVPQQSGTVSINAGGSAAGSFVADANFSGGSTYSTTNTIDTSQISGTVPPQTVFQTERYGEFTYTIPNRTPGSTQTVTLYFQESYWTAAGQRLFNVSINGSTVLSAFDIFAAAGGANRAIARTFTTTANASGQVVIQFIRGNGPDNPKVTGITVAGG